MLGNHSYGTDGSGRESLTSLFGTYTEKGGELHILEDTVTYT